MKIVPEPSCARLSINMDILISPIKQARHILTMNRAFMGLYKCRNYSLSKISCYKLAPKMTTAFQAKQDGKFIEIKQALRVNLIEWIKTLRTDTTETTKPFWKFEFVLTLMT